MIATDSLDQLFTEAATKDAEPLWTQMETMVPPHPEPKAVPHLWRYAEMRPLLVRSGRLVGTKDAERRVFMLVNPALKAPQTTDTLYAGLQLILPGEIARAHRHVAFALRFIIEGDGAFTAVGGEKVTMSRGDVILTPQWEFHDHGHEGTTPMIWLDGLDLPVYQFFPANFAQPYAAEQPDPFAYAEYTHRRDGGPISRVIGAAAERIAARSSAPARRETAGIIYHVYEGRGRTQIGEQTVSWEPGDTFCIPSWTQYRHDATTQSYLFRYDDAPVLRAIGGYRSEQGAA